MIDGAVSLESVLEYGGPAALVAFLLWLLRKDLSAALEQLREISSRLNEVEEDLSELRLDMRLPPKRDRE